VVAGRDRPRLSDARVAPVKTTPVSMHEDCGNAWIYADDVEFIARILAKISTPVLITAPGFEFENASELSKSGVSVLKSIEIEIRDPTISFKVDTVDARFYARERSSTAIGVLTDVRGYIEAHCRPPWWVRVLQTPWLMTPLMIAAVTIPLALAAWKSAWTRAHFPIFVGLAFAMLMLGIFPLAGFAVRTRCRVFTAPRPKGPGFIATNRDKLLYSIVEKGVIALLALVAGWLLKRFFG
jgi:hypothetical protein